MIQRTVECGLVKESHVGTLISLTGWVNKRRDHGGLIFVDLRDRSGLMQLVFDPQVNQSAHALAESLRSEFVIGVSGTVIERTPSTINNAMETGKWELIVDQLEIFNTSKNPPFALDDGDTVDEEVRLTYRYLDLRRTTMQKSIALRHTIIFMIRQFLHEKKFYEIETPILTKNTPEGAREFLVPSRLQKGSFYVLPQSPQLYKQLLMASGMERYFQIARCFRDEDLRADRQPEFTQLDIEISFSSENIIQNLIEELLCLIFKQALNIEIKRPFFRLKYDDAFCLYGSDKPDLRFELPIIDVTNVFLSTELQFLKSVIATNGKIGALHVASHEFSHSELNRWVLKAQELGAKGLLWITVNADGSVDSPVHKFLSSDFVAQMQNIIPNFGPGSTLFISAGKYQTSWTLLGQLRLALAKQLELINDSEFNFSWVTDFPLLEYDEKENRWNSVHHPFTAPQIGYKEQSFEDIKARAYDVVLNGVELGGGSIRIHNRAEQQEIFTMLGLDQKKMEEKFGFLLQAQEYGFPPHGGIALGIDRLIMMMAKKDSIREVIAFPKTQRGIDMMMHAPTPVDQVALKEYGLQLEKK